jgi:hypothetical protein
MNEPKVTPADLTQAEKEWDQWCKEYLRQNAIQPNPHANILLEHRSLKLRLRSMLYRLSVLAERIEWSEVLYFLGSVALIVLFFVLYGLQSR